MALKLGKREAMVQILRFTNIVIQDQEDEIVLTAEEFLRLLRSRNVAAMSIPRHFLLNNKYILFFSTCSPGPEYEMHGADNVYIHFRVIAKQRVGELEQSCCPTVKS